MKIPMPLIRVFIAIAIMAIVTFFTRVLPFLFFKDKKTPKIILFLEEYVPPTIMLLLVIYCLKDAKWQGPSHGIPELSGIALVATLHFWKRNALISIFAGTAFYMFLIQVVF